MTSLVSFLTAVAEALESEDGQRLGSLLSLTLGDGQALSLQQLLGKRKEMTVRNFVPSPWADIVLGHLAVRQTIGQADVDYSSAAQAQNALLQLFLQLFGSLGAWVMPLLYRLTADLRTLSSLADRSSRRSSGALEEACRTLNRAFSYCITDRLSPPGTSRKWGTYAMAGWLFKTYFRLASTNLCSTVLRSIQAAELPDLTAFPKADQATFHYYSGILAFLNEQYSRAEEELVKVLALCSFPGDRMKQQRL